MPADGEFKFSSIANKTVWNEYHKYKSDSCSGPALVNGSITGLFSFAGTYIYTHNARTAFKTCGIVGALGYLITGVVCTLEKMKNS